MNGKHCKGQGWEGSAWGSYPGLSQHAFACLLENNTLRKASKEVHILLVTSEKTCTSLLRNVPSLHTACCFRHLASPHRCKFIYPFILPLSPSSLSLSPPHKITLVSTNLEAEPSPVIAYLMLLSIFRQKNISGHKVLCLFPEA